MISRRIQTEEARIDAIGYRDFRANLKCVMDQVVADRSPVVITRSGSEPVVMVSLADWIAAEETSHLLSNPRNTARLFESIRELDARASIEPTP